MNHKDWGPIFGSAPYWLLGIAISTGSLAIAFSNPSRPIALYMIVVAPLLTAIIVTWAYLRGQIDVLEERIVASIPEKLRLTGGGPMDGMTIPHPALADGMNKLVLTDHDTNEPLGAYVQEDPLSDRLVWDSGATYT